MPVLAQFSSIAYLLLMAVVVWVLMTVNRGRRRVAQQNERRRALDDSPERTSVGASHSFADATAGRHAEARQTVQNLLAQLDTRIAALEQWIREADRVAARLESALAAARPESLGAASGGRLSRVPGTLGSSPAADPDEASPNASDAAHETYPASPGSQADALRSAGVVSSRPQPELRDETMVVARPPADRRYEEIYTLADYGLDASEIAQRVGSPVGEVQLILGLRGQRRD